MGTKQSAGILLAGILFAVVGFALPMVSFDDMSMFSLLSGAALNLQNLTFIALILGTLINIGIAVTIFRDSDLSNRVLLAAAGLIFVGIAGLAAYWYNFNGLPLLFGERVIFLRIGFYVIAVGAVIQLISLALLARENTSASPAIAD